MCDLCLPRRRVLTGLAVVPFVGLLGSVSPAGARTSPDLVIRPRSEWAGTNHPSRGDTTAEDVRFLLVHHTAGPTDYAEAEVPQLIRNIHAFHTGDEKGWPDVAYNFLIDRYGGVWEARQGSLAGAVRGDATGGNQGYSQLVCVMGTFTDQLPTTAALDSLVSTLAWLADRHGLDTAAGATTTFESLGSNRHAAGTTVTTPVITGHRAMSQTSCPGEALFTYVESGLMTDVSAVRSGELNPGPASTTSTTGSTAEPASSNSEADSGGTESVPPSSVTSNPSSTDTVERVPFTRESTDDSLPIEDRTGLDQQQNQAAVVDEKAQDPGSGGTISAWQGAALAGTAAAAAGLLTLRRRSQPAATTDGPREDG